jgi:hydroxyethylthiazole kinase-like uncharacterized protein yjeF
MRYLTAAEMREADRRAIEELGIPGAVLMNNAGAAVYRELPSDTSVTVVCGKGNNGGDGYVVARLALLDRRSVRVVLLAEPESITGDARTFLDVYRRLRGPIAVATNKTSLGSAFAEIGTDEVLVDALLGTGIRGEVTGLYRHAIESWPTGTTIAVDLPSGMDADTGEPCGCCIRATKTVTLQFPKAGFQNQAAKEYLGKWSVADIGIPAVCADEDAWRKLTAP